MVLLVELRKKYEGATEQLNSVNAERDRLHILGGSSQQISELNKKIRRLNEIQNNTASRIAELERRQTRREEQLVYQQRQKELAQERNAEGYMAKKGEIAGVSYDVPETATIHPEFLTNIGVRPTLSKRETLIADKDYESTIRETAEAHAESLLKKQQKAAEKAGMKLYGMTEEGGHVYERPTNLGVSTGYYAPLEEFEEGKTFIRYEKTPRETEKPLPIPNVFGLGSGGEVRAQKKGFGGIRERTEQLKTSVITQTGISPITQMFRAELGGEYGTPVITLPRSMTEHADTLEKVEKGIERTGEKWELVYKQTRSPLMKNVAAGMSRIVMPLAGLTYELPKEAIRKPFETVVGGGIAIAAFGGLGKLGGVLGKKVGGGVGEKVGTAAASWGLVYGGVGASMAFSPPKSQYETSKRLAEPLIFATYVTTAVRGAKYARTLPKAVREGFPKGTFQTYKLRGAEIVSKTEKAGDKFITKIEPLFFEEVGKPTPYGGILRKLDIVRGYKKPPKPAKSFFLQTESQLTKLYPEKGGFQIYRTPVLVKAKQTRTREGGYTFEPFKQGKPELIAEADLPTPTKPFKTVPKSFLEEQKISVPPYQRRKWKTPYFTPTKYGGKYYPGRFAQQNVTGYTKTRFKTLIGRIEKSPNISYPSIRSPKHQYRIIYEGGEVGLPQRMFYRGVFEQKPIFPTRRKAETFAKSKLGFDFKWQIEKQPSLTQTSFGRFTPSPRPKKSRKAVMPKKFVDIDKALKDLAMKGVMRKGGQKEYLVEMGGKSGIVQLMPLGRAQQKALQILKRPQTQRAPRIITKVLVTKKGGMKSELTKKKMMIYAPTQLASYPKQEEIWEEYEYFAPESFRGGEKRSIALLTIPEKPTPKPPITLTFEKPKMREKRFAGIKTYLKPTLKTETGLGLRLRQKMMPTQKQKQVTEQIIKPIQQPKPFTEIIPIPRTKPETKIMPRIDMPIRITQKFKFPTPPKPEIGLRFGETFRIAPLSFPLGIKGRGTGLRTLLGGRGLKYRPSLVGIVKGIREPSRKKRGLYTGLEIRGL